MSKKKFYYTEAERLYVEEQMTIKEISSRFNVSVRTLKTWKKENDWSEKRQEFITLKHMCLKDFNIFFHKMFSNLQDDLANRREISSGRFYRFNKQFDMCIKYMKAVPIFNEFLENNPDFGRENSDEKPKIIPPEAIRQIRRDILGMKD